MPSQSSSSDFAVGVEMSKFGKGWGNDFRLLDARPCNTNETNLKQRIHNSLFQRDAITGDKFADERPDWFKAKPVVAKDGKSKKIVTEQPEQSGGPHGNDKISTADISNKSLGNGGKVGMQTNVRTSSRGQAIANAVSLQANDGNAAKILNSRGLMVPKIDFEKVGSEGGQSARSRVTTATFKSRSSGLSDASSVSSHPRLHSGFSRRSGARSHTPSMASSYSGLSRTSSINQDDILQRIKGLEMALIKERALREKMQAILEERVSPGVAGL